MSRLNESPQANNGEGCENDQYAVEKIIGKKFKHGRIEYLVKWLDYTSKYNKWVDVDSCACDEKIAEYESRDIIGILGCTKTHRSIKYAAFKKGKRLFELINSLKMVQNYPVDMLEFLQSRLKFENAQMVNFADEDIVNALTPIGQPTLLGVSNLNGFLKYWFECDAANNMKARKILSAVQVKNQLDIFLPPIVAFLEERMVFVGGHPHPEYDMFKLTKAVDDKLEETDVALNTEIPIQRHAGLERFLIENARENRNRARLSVPIRATPFGVSGRRRIRSRRQTTILFIGVQANLDISHRPEKRQWAPVRPPTPQSRRVCRRLQFDESPDRHMVSSTPAAEDSLVDFSIIDAFGQLSLNTD